MSKTAIGLISAVGLLVLTVVVFGTAYLNFNREEVRARNLCEAQKGNVENVLDNMWKTFQEIGGIAVHERETAMELFVSYAEGRTSEGSGKMMSWVQEQNPTLDSSLFKDLRARLEAGRAEFSNSQTRMLDLIAAHENLIEDPFGKLFLSNTTHFEYEVISSADTKRAVETGEDERVFKLGSE